MKKILFSLFALHFSLVEAFAADDCRGQKHAPDGELTLTQVVELGLCRNPTTAAAYLSLESSRLSKNAGYAGYLPSVSANAGIERSFNGRHWAGDPGANLGLSASWLIFDFGKRLADLNALAAVWRATGFDYDESVQNFVYSLIGSYYGLLTADADVKTAESLRIVAQTAKDTADKKFKAGVVARADVLKADTTLASRELDLQRARNNREIARGKLLSQLSFAATDEIKIADMPSNFGSAAESKTIEELLAVAKKQRPDLLRADENKNAAWHRRNSAVLKNLPSISASGSISYYSSVDEFAPSVDRSGGSIGIRASMPLFAGFANVYGARAAQANLDAADQRLRAADDNATLDVFTAFANYKTARTVLAQTVVLLKSATESEKLTAGMYKVGKATMLDWQNAQAELASAEKQSNSAKYDLFVKRAALALAVGDIKQELGN
ncbi:MAG: TolC family protein [Rickettsiales bacterium]|jgi:outer membrane protein|nr:TolC family protein [Rickettsiales bacterium]